MMTATLRIVLILVSLGTFFLMIHKIRQARIQIESALFWIFLSMILVIYSLFPPVADFCAKILGIYATANFLFLFAIFILIVKVFYMTIHISQLEMRLKDLVQKVALEEKKREEARRSGETSFVSEPEQVVGQEYSKTHVKISDDKSPCDSKALNKTKESRYEEG